MGELIARRQFTPMYIWLDLAFLLFFAGLLLYKRKYMTVAVGAVFGVIYMVVDYGIFHLVCHSRSITGGNLFWVLLWMSMSYGFTNFAWIWLWISKNKDLLEWSILILLWWFCCPLLTQTFGGFWVPVVIQRTTGSYHGYMAMLLFAGYLFLLVWNLAHSDKREKMPLLWLLAMGVLVQFGWEAGLLLGGIRSAGFDFLSSLRTLVIQSLLETNLGMPYIFCIYLWYHSRWNEDLSKRETPVTFLESLRENNAMKVRGSHS